MADAESTPPTFLVPSSKDDPISASLRDVLAVFDESLSDVKFPDVDSEALQVQAELVEQHHADVKRLEQALDEAKKKLEESTDSLVHKAQRAVAYARVYADGDVLLTSRLEAITLPRAKQKAQQTTEQPQKKRKQKQTPAPDASLFAPASSDGDEESIVA